VVACFDLLSRRLHGGTEEKQKMVSRMGIRTGHLPNTSQNRLRLSNLLIVEWEDVV
jgi:hypothetical protein